MKLLKYSKTRVKTLVFIVLSLHLAKAQEKPALDFQSSPNHADFGQVTLSLHATLAAKLKELNISQENCQQILSVYVGDKIPEDLPPVAGNYVLKANALYFKPRFEPPPGITYTILFSADVLGKLIEDKSITAAMNLSKTITIPKVDLVPETIVKNIYPTAQKLPSNLLKFYIEFSHPMGYENPYGLIKLYDQQDNEIVDPFVEITEGLWDKSKTRLTVFVHPGRVKRGVGPNMTMGPVFETGKSYRLVVKKIWKDQNGLPLKTTFEKLFRIVQADRKQVDTRQWAFKKPKVGSQDHLQIDFGESLDHALAQRMIRVKGVDGKLLEGNVSLANDQSSWLFQPAKNWRKGTYTLFIDFKIEDLAGNNQIGVFDKTVSPNDRREEEISQFEIIKIAID